MKKIIILIIAIILPLVGAFMIGWYGVAVRYEPEKHRCILLFKNYLNKGVITSEGRIKTIANLKIIIMMKIHYT